MPAATLSSKFQVSVPKEVRDTLGLVAGQKVVFINTGSAVKLLAQPSMAELAGIARGASSAGLRDRDERRALPVVARTSKRRKAVASKPAAPRR